MLKRLFLCIFLYLSVYTYTYGQIKFSDLPDTLQVDTDTKYAVHWDVAFTPVVTQNDATDELLEHMLYAVRMLSVNGSLVDGYLIYEHPDSSMDDLYKIGMYLYRCSLPDPYSWFIGFKKSDTLVFGIKDMSDVFRANIAEAAVFIENYSPVVAFRLDSGERTCVTDAFESFTERCLFKIIAIEVYDNLLMTQLLNAPIVRGVVEIADLPVPIINKIFSYTVAEIEEKIVVCD